MGGLLSSQKLYPFMNMGVIITNFNTTITSGIYMVGLGSSGNPEGLPTGMHPYGVLAVFVGKTYITQMYVTFHTTSAKIGIATRTGDINNISIQPWLYYAGVKLT